MSRDDPYLTVSEVLVCLAIAFVLACFAVAYWLRSH